MNNIVHQVRREESPSRRNKTLESIKHCEKRKGHPARKDFNKKEEKKKKKNRVQEFSLR